MKSYGHDVSKRFFLISVFPHDGNLILKEHLSNVGSYCEISNLKIVDLYVLNCIFHDSTGIAKMRCFLFKVSSFNIIIFYLKFNIFV